MPDFTQRSYQKELLDEEFIPQTDLWQNLKELNIINRYLGGHSATISALNKLNLKPNYTYTILDIGCGGGDTLRAVAKWARHKKINLQLTGVDLKEDCVQYAKQACEEYENISVLQTDYRDVVKQNSRYDIIITSLFCHHLSNEEIMELLQWCKQHAQVATIINDLHRHALAYYSIKVLTKLFSKSYLVKNDAPLSVLRGFSRIDLDSITLNDTHTKIYWSWAFRWIIIQFNKTYANT